MIAALAAAVPVVNGWQAQQTWRDGVAGLDAWLAGAGDGAGARVLDYQRGLYSARARSLIHLPASTLSAPLRAALALPPGPIELRLEQTIRHGWRGVSFEGYVQPIGALADAFARVGGDSRSLRINGRVGFARQSVALQTKALSGPLDRNGTVEARLEPVQLNADYARRDRSLTAALDWPGLLLEALDTNDKLRLEGIRLDTDARLVAGSPVQGVWVGESRLGLTSFRLEPAAATAAAIALEQLAVNATSEQADTGLMDARLTVDWQRLAMAGQPTLRGGLTLDFEGLAPAGLLALSRQTARGGLPDTLAAGPRQALALLAEAGPRVGLTRLRLENLAGAGMSARADLQIRPVMAARLRTGHDPMALWSALRLDAEMGIDPALAQALPAEQMAWLQQLQAFGILRQIDGEWRLAVSMDEGRLSIHGQPWWDGG